MLARRSFSAVCLVAAATAFSFAAGCSSTDTNNDSDPGGDGGRAPTTSSSSSGKPQQDKAQVRVVHASPNAPAVDIYVKGESQPVATGLAYGDATDYLELAPGTYVLELRASPSTSKDPVAFTTQAMPMRDGEKITAVAAGSFGSSTDGDKFRVLALEEGFGAAGSGSAIVRVVHVGADAPPVSLDLDDDDATSPEINGIDRFSDSGKAGFPLTAGREDAIGIVVGGARFTSFTTPKLPEGAEIFVFATGLTKKLGREADGFALLAVGPSGSLGFVKQDPQVYALHASPNAPEVDAFVGPTKIVDGVSFGMLAGPLQVRPASYDLDFFAHADGAARPAGAPAGSGSTGPLERGERYLAVATGLLGGDTTNSFRVATYAEGFALDDATNGRIRVVHASPDAPPVDVGVLNVEHVVSPVLVPGISFGQASDLAGLSTSTGTVPFGVAPAGDDATVVAAIHVPVTAGVRAFALAAGALSPENGQTFRLLAVDTSTSPWTAATVMPQPQQ